MDNIILEVAIGLVNCFNNRNFLIFPEYHNKGKEKTRISEQESKILFANELLNKKIRFAIEVPTKTKHIQTGKTPQSARFDLVTYDNKSYDFDWVIELKSKNPPLYHFKKDFEKMVLTESNCIWFHTLKNSNERTYEVLLGKINNGINSVIKKHKGKHIWKIAIVILEKMELFVFDINLNEKEYDKINSIGQFKKEDLSRIIKGI